MKCYSYSIFHTCFPGYPWVHSWLPRFRIYFHKYIYRFLQKLIFNMTQFMFVTQKVRRVQKVSHFNFQRAGTGASLTVLYEEDLERQNYKNEKRNTQADRCSLQRNKLIERKPKTCFRTPRRSIVMETSDHFAYYFHYWISQGRLYCTVGTYNWVVLCFAGRPGL